MKRLAILTLMPALLFACGPAEDSDEAGEAPKAGIQLDVTPPEALELPELREVASDDDWEARVNNKNREVIQVINIINPVAAHVTKGFEGYGDRFSPTLEEEWADTQVQLTAATTLYGSCKERMTAGEYDKKLFLDLEEVWQLLVKTGVAGVRTKSMVDAELARMTS